ncbi:hypothetical protein VO64_5180 [Pseudomonas synxantha]|uniref:Uncharacterized protein n=1 Tax=Pseudomonas synxantha TaxID=47883 RepID=A0AAU8TUL5_9PSED|nr:hypothetical protein VO64_5180 [Pseudomonas synxantha]
MLCPAPGTLSGQRRFEVLAGLLTSRSGTRTKRIMLLYTNKANNVFDCLGKRG